MSGEEPKARPKAEPSKLAEVVSLPSAAMAAEQPAELSAPEALKVVRLLAADTANIVVHPYGARRAKERRPPITRRQIELCVQRGTIVEGPSLSPFGKWKMNFYRHAAGEQITCVVEIEWATKLLIINAF